MEPLDLQSEPYSDLGNISAEGIGKILGTPRFDRWQIVIRETVQNSWDARRPGSMPAYKLRLRTLSPEQQRLLRETMLRSLPPDAAGRDSLSGVLRQTELRVLEIADYGTTGLGGPLRANVLEDNEATDFVDFMRNVGSPRDTHLGGGTYGYGKTSLYALSECRTVFVHSRTRHYGAPTERLIGCRLGDPYKVMSGEQRGHYTGRHWWGRRSSRDHIVDPVVDDEARGLAEQLGLFPRSGSDFGTTLMILCPTLEGRSMQEAADAAVESLLWFFWPKMAAAPKPSMSFEVFLEDGPVMLPPLSACPPLGVFEDALRHLKGCAGDGAAASNFDVECGRPKKHLGRLCLAKGYKWNRRSFARGEDCDALIPDTSRHVALMRPAELVVKYLEGPALPSDSMEYGGVFICDEDVEQAFAQAEPPAHDDWVPDYLTGHDKTYVRVALKRLKEHIDRFAEPRTAAENSGGSGTSFGMLGDSLGDLLMGAPGQRLGGRRSSSGGSSRKRKVTVSGPRPTGFDTIDGIDCALFEVGVESTADADVVLSGRPAVVLFDGSAPDAADGSRPELIRWTSEDGLVLARGSDLRVGLAAGKAHTFAAAVSLPGECKVKLSVAAEEDPS